MPDFILCGRSQMNCKLSTGDAQAWNKRAGASVLISEDVEWRTQAYQRELRARAVHPGHGGFFAGVQVQGAGQGRKVLFHFQQAGNLSVLSARFTRR
jgi:hypothetical protein